MPGVERRTFFGVTSNKAGLSLVLLLTSCVTYTSCLTSLSLGFPSYNENNA